MQELKETTVYRQSLKLRIMEVALRAFSERGIRAVKMDDVASMLGISKRTLYEVYKDKEELLFQCLKAFDEERKERTRQFCEQERNVMDIIIFAYRQKVEETQRINPVFYDDIHKYPRVVRYMEDQHERTREQFLQFLLRGVDEGFFRPDVNYSMVPHLFDGIGRYVMDNRLFKKYSFKEMFSTLLLIPLRGFCTEKGLAVLEDTEF